MARVGHGKAVVVIDPEPDGALRLRDLDPATYSPHATHQGERIWSETNCYADLWIEVLHAFGLEPLASAAYTLATDFEGTQWSFFKPPIEDLWECYGIEVGEFNVWRPVIDHVEEQLRLGRLLTVDVDAWYLPDTAGVSYHLSHVKSSIVPQSLDRAHSVLGYFHNSGYHELSGTDWDGVWQTPLLPPYVELVRLDHLRGDDQGLTDAALRLTRRHLARRPTNNPVSRLGARIQRDLAWLAAEGMDTFHLYAFGTCRQCGASAEIAASFVRWLSERTGTDAGSAADDLELVAQQAKSLQFALARAARGRKVDLGGIIEPMADAWDRAMSTLVAVYGT